LGQIVVRFDANLWVNTVIDLPNIIGWCQKAIKPLEYQSKNPRFLAQHADLQLKINAQTTTAWCQIAGRFDTNL